MSNFNDKLLLREFITFDYHKSKADEEGKPKISKYGNLLVRGIVQRSDALNQNGRIYPHRTLQSQVENYMQLVKERRATGELDHCDSPTVNLKNASHIITDLWWEGNDLWGEIEVLEDMIQGRQLKALLKNDVKIGISSRALGSVQRMGEANVVQDDLYLVCWDIVSEPSTHGAFMMQENKIISKNEYDSIVSKSHKINLITNEIIHNYKKS